MMKEADLIGLDEEQARRFAELDREISQSREGVLAWHRLLDRRRLDRKLGLHPISEFAIEGTRATGDSGRLMRKEAAAAGEGARREPFHVSSEAEARGLLLRCVGYLSDAAGERLAFDKGYGGRDKMAEWIIKEIKEEGGLAYIGKHKPYIFGIPIAVASA